MASGQNATASAPPPRPPPPPLLVVRRPPPPSPPPPSPPQPPPPAAQDNAATNRIIIIGTAAIAIGGTLIICCLAVLLIYLLRSQYRKRKEKRQKARRASYLADVEAGLPGGGDKGGPGRPGAGRGGAHDKLRSPMLSGVGDIPSRPTSIDGPGGISPVHSMRQRDIAPDAADAIRAAMLAVFDGGDGGMDADNGMGRRHASATDVGDGLQRSDSWAQPVAPRMASHIDAAGPRGGAAAAAAMRFSGAGTAAAASGNSSRWRMSRFGRNAGAAGGAGLGGQDSPLAHSRSKTASGLITSDRVAEAVLKPAVSVPQGSALLRSTLAEHASSPGGSSGPNTPPWVRGHRRVEVITGHDEDDELMVMEPGEAVDEEEDADTLGLGPFTQDGEVVSFSKGGSGGGPPSAGALPLRLAGSSDSGKGLEAATAAEGKGGKDDKDDKEGKEGKEKKKKGFLGFKSKKKKKEEPSMVSNPTYKPAYMMPTAAMAAKSGLDLTKEADKYEKRPSRFGTATPPPGSPAVGGRAAAPSAPLVAAGASPARSRTDSPARKGATHAGYAHVSTFGPGGPSYTGAAAAQGAKLRRLHGSADASAGPSMRRNTLAGLMASAGSGTEGGSRRMTAPGSAAGSRHNLGEHIGPMGSTPSMADLKALEKTLPGSPRRASLVIPDSAFAAMAAQHGLKDGDDPVGV